MDYSREEYEAARYAERQWWSWPQITIEDCDESWPGNTPADELASTSGERERHGAEPGLQDLFSVETQERR